MQKLPSEIFYEKTKKTCFYSIQPIDNIHSIIIRGLLSNERANSIKHTSIAMPDVQLRRDNVRIPNGKRLHQYVNIYFDSWNPMLSKRRDINNDICILEITSDILNFEETIITDMNASSPYASFYSPAEGLEKINFDLVFAHYWFNDTLSEYENRLNKLIKCAEILVPYRLHYDFITGAIVIDDAASLKLQETGFEKLITVDPNHFFRR